MRKLNTRALSCLAGGPILGIVALLAACSGSVLGPDRGAPFYYYEHQPIYLKVDPAGMVILPIDELASDSAAVRDAVEARLARHGLEIYTMRSLGPPPFNWLVQLAGTVNADAAAAAREELLMAAEFRAVIPTYRIVDGDLPLYVLNRAVAQFKDGVSLVQITNFVAALGAQVVAVQHWGPAGDIYLIEPASGSHAHILNIANAIDESSIALWGTPDMVSPNIGPVSLLMRGQSDRY